jgi:hypothetical protein
VAAEGEWHIVNFSASESIGRRVDVAGGEGGRGFSVAERRAKVSERQLSFARYRVRQISSALGPGPVMALGDHGQRPWATS